MKKLTVLTFAGVLAIVSGANAEIASTQYVTKTAQAKSSEAYSMGNAAGGWTTLTAAEQDAIKSGITAEKVATYDAFDEGKQDTLSETQMAAVNSGITSTKVAAYDAFAEGKQDALSETQMAAVNSGITSTKVAAYDAFAEGKQDALSETQMAAVNSGITSTKVAEYDGYAEGKQDALTAGSNVLIKEVEGVLTISATDTVYDDTALAGRVSANETAIETLQGALSAMAAGTCAKGSTCALTYTPKTGEGETGGTWAFEAINAGSNE